MSNDLFSLVGEVCFLSFIGEEFFLGLLLAFLRGEAGGCYVSMVFWGWFYLLREVSWGMPEVPFGAACTSFCFLFWKLSE